MAGARDLFDVAGADGTVIHPGDPAWTQAYVADVEHLFRILGATGAPIVAVKPTCYGQNTLPDAEGQASERLDPVRVAGRRPPPGGPRRVPSGSDCSTSTR